MKGLLSELGAKDYMKITSCVTHRGKDSEVFSGKEVSEKLKVLNPAQAASEILRSVGTTETTLQHQSRRD